MARIKTKEKRTLILETAKRLFAAKGESVSMNGIAKEIGISVGSIYTYFPSKPPIPIPFVGFSGHFSRKDATKPTPVQKSAHMLLLFAGPTMMIPGLSRFS